MRTLKENNTLTIFLEGELSSNNAIETDKKIEKKLEKEKPTEIIFDIEKLNYISSAGLRLMLKYKKDYKDFEVRNASLEVYDIFQMTGFTDIMKVSKALKEIDISNATMIGEGYCSWVYQIDKDTIIKVFKFATDINDVERELKLGKEAFVLGIPTAITYDIVKVKDKFGARFELLDCLSLKDVLLKNPNNVDEIINKYADLIIKIGSTEAVGNFPSCKEWWLNKVEVIKDCLEEKDYLKLKKIIESIEDRRTFVHGDCHVKNIMCQDDEMLIIDMDTLSYGHPIFELALIHSPYIAFEEVDPGNSEIFFGLPTQLTNKLYYDTISKVLKDKDSKKIRDEIALLSYSHMVYWEKVNEPERVDRLNFLKEKFLGLLSKIDKIDF